MEKRDRPWRDLLGQLEDTVEAGWAEQGWGGVEVPQGGIRAEPKARACEHGSSLGYPVRYHPPRVAPSGIRIF